MPAFTNVVEIVMRGQLTETSFVKNIANVFHYRLFTGSADSKSNIVNNWQTNVGAPIVGQLTTDYLEVAVDIRLLDDPLDQYLTITPALAGGQALPRLPGDLAVVLPLRSASRGKNYRGSKHFSAPPSAYVTKDELNVTGTAAWNGIASILLANLTLAGGAVYSPIVLSRNLSQLRTLPTTVWGSDIVTVLLNKTIGTMRRRKEKTVR